MNEGSSKEKEEFAEYNEEVTQYLKKQQNGYLNEMLRSSLDVVKDFLKEKKIEADVKTIIETDYENARWLTIFVNTDIEDYEERRELWKAIERRIKKIYESRLRNAGDEEEIEDVKVANTLLNTMVR